MTCHTAPPDMNFLTSWTYPRLTPTRCRGMPEILECYCLTSVLLQGLEFPLSHGHRQRVSKACMEYTNDSSRLDAIASLRLAFLFALSCSMSQSACPSGSRTWRTPDLRPILDDLLAPVLKLSHHLSDLYHSIGHNRDCTFP
jgi:hypothetical protein